jgi:3-phenylpropionate/trans-cinnamate dioxygenase ferredoxin subunit
MKTAVAKFDDLVDGQATKVLHGKRALVMVRLGDEVYCLADKCTHEDFPLSDGQVISELGEIECDRHGATFRLADGAPCSLPATKAVPTYEVSVVDGVVEVDL